MSNKRIIKMITSQFTFDTFLNNSEYVFNVIDRFENLHKCCKAPSPYSGDLRYPFTAPKMCEYNIVFDKYDSEEPMVSMSCAIHEDDYIPIVNVLFLSNELPDDISINKLTYQFIEYTIGVFVNKGHSMMDFKRYVEEHLAGYDLMPIIKYYQYIKNKYSKNERIDF